MRQKKRFVRTRALYLKARRSLKPWARVAIKGAAAGIGAYSAMRLGSKVLGPIGRSRLAAKYSPKLAEEIGNMGHSAMNWGLGTGALVTAGGMKDLAKEKAKKRWRRWVKRGV
jgi:hypothetical protein